MDIFFLNTKVQALFISKKIMKLGTWIIVKDYLVCLDTS